MGKLIVVRHGQASFHEKNYDNLSPLGEAQGRALGMYWCKLGFNWDRVYIGPKQRHRQTYEQVAQVYRETGLVFPEPVVLNNLNEHQGASVVRHVISGEKDLDGILPQAIKRGGEEAERAYFLRFQEITRAWAGGTLEAPDFQPWQDFRSKVRNGLQQMTQTGFGDRVVAFSSGGPLAVSVGEALKLDDVQVMALSWIVRNAAYAEYVFSKNRFTQISFNEVPHLDRPELYTMI